MNNKCTLFPSKFGTLEHQNLCEEHKAIYMESRNLITKLKADIEWYVKLLNIHASNELHWILAAYISATLALIALLTLGTLVWLKLQYWDDRNGKTGIKTKLKRLWSEKVGRTRNDD